MIVLPVVWNSMMEFAAVMVGVKATVAQDLKTARIVPKTVAVVRDGGHLHLVSQTASILRGHPHVVVYLVILGYVEVILVTNA